MWIIGAVAVVAAVAAHTDHSDWGEHSAHSDAAERAARERRRKEEERQKNFERAREELNNTLSSTRSLLAAEAGNEKAKFETWDYDAYSLDYKNFDSDYG
ncbi:MAG: hypothetical protein K2H64_00250, partial [Desulfovibrio sp.]|nr:hypothetical protein [Desulfovibrio sp.]